MVKPVQTSGLRRYDDPNRVPRYTILDSDGNVVPEAELFLRDVSVRSMSGNTLRTYRDGVFDFLCFIDVHGVAVADVKRAHVVNYLLALNEKVNPQRGFRTSGIEPGTVNERTGKPYLPKGYQPRTRNLRQTIVSLFYDVLALNGLGPAIHPVVRIRTSRPSARVSGRSNDQRSLRVRVPEKTPVVLPDELIAEMIERARCLRDTALLEGLHCSAARAEEMVQMKIGDILWTDAKILLNTKGQNKKIAVRVTQKFLEVVRKYLDERGGRQSQQDPVWVTEPGHGPQRPLTYTALRAILRRLNEQLGSNVTAHNFRSTCATKLAQASGVGPLAVQNHLRHRSFESTQIYIKLNEVSNSKVLENIDEIFKFSPIKKMNANFDQGALERIFGIK